MSDDETYSIDDCDSAFVRDFMPYKGRPDPLVVWRAAWQSCVRDALAAKEAEIAEMRAALRDAVAELIALKGLEGAAADAPEGQTAEPVAWASENADSFISAATKLADPGFARLYPTPLYDAALGGIYEAIGAGLRENGREDASGARRAAANAIERDDFAMAARLIGCTAEQAEALKRAFAASPSAGQAPEGQQAGVPDSDFIVQDDEGQPMFVTSHHYTAENVRALIAELRRLADPKQSSQAEWDAKDWRGWCNVLWRVMTALAVDVPRAAAQAEGQPAAAGPRLLPLFKAVLSLSLNDCKVPLDMANAIEAAFARRVKPAAPEGEQR